MEPIPGRNTFENTPPKTRAFYESEELWWYICMIENGLNPRQIPLHTAQSKLNWGWWWTS